MSIFFLVYKNLFRKKLRAFLLSLAIFVAFLIFGVLVGFNNAMDFKPRDGEAERMVVLNKVNFTQFIPYAYYTRIKAMEGVATAYHQTWFGAYFRDPGAGFMVGFATNPEEFTAVNAKRFELTDEQIKAWVNDRTGILVGKDLADKWGWKVGDQVPISSNIFSQKDGSKTWTFHVSAIFSPVKNPGQTSVLYLNYDYFNESRTLARDTISQVIFVTNDPKLDDVLAKRIDAEFTNSSVQTKTTTASAFNKSFLASLGNLTLIITSVVGAAFVSILLVVGNTMVMAIRERTREIAVMKTIGFSPAQIFRMIISETILLAVVGGTLGLGVGLWLLQVVSKLGFIALPLGDSWIVAVEGAALMVALGLVTGFLPAYNAMRLNIVTGLGRN